MLTYRVAPYPFELVKSLIARYRIHTLSSQRGVIKTLFNSHNRSINPLFPNRLMQLSKSLSLDPHELLTKHTLYPIISIFGSASLASSTKEDMLHGVSNTVAPIFKKTPTLRFCPLCVIEDRKLFGETYWHRCHNIPFFRTCVHHSCDLQDWQPTMDQSHQNIYSAEKNIKDDIKPKYVNQAFNSFEKRFIEIINSLSKIDLSDTIANGVKSGIIKTNRQGFQSLDSLAEVYNAFVLEKYPFLYDPYKLTRIQLSILLTKENSLSRPYIPILFNDFLRSSQSKISQLERGNMICINKSCSNFRKTITSINPRIIECPSCALVYQLSYKKGKPRRNILNYGLLLEKKAETLHKASMPLIEISKTLQINIRIVESMLAKKMESEDYKAKLDKMRNSWLEVLNQNPLLSIQEKKIKSGTIYKWLQKWDKEWLVETNRHHRKVIGHNSTKHASKDIRILGQLKESYGQINLEIFKKRVSINLLLSRIRGVRAFDLKNLPESLKYAKSIEESIMAFNKRRVKLLLHGDNKNDFTSPSSIFGKLGLYNNRDLEERDEMLQFIKDQLAK